MLAIISQKKVCNFVEDCKDGTDEATCPSQFTFDDCESRTGDKMCYWREGVHDDMEWVIKNINQTKDLPLGPKEADGFDSFLFVESVPDGHDNMAMIESPVYQDTAVTCTVSYDYYIAGNSDESVITVALRKDDVDLPIDFLRIGEDPDPPKFLYRETTIGRKMDDVQVKCMQNSVM